MQIMGKDSKIISVMNMIVIEKAIPEAKIEALKVYMQRFKADEASDGTLANSSSGVMKGDNDSGVRACKTTWIHPDAKFTQEIVGMISELITQVNMQYYGFNFHRPEPIQYTHYSYHESAENKDHYDWHIDSSLNSDARPIDRKLSMSLQLSDHDDYKGCDLTFPDFERYLVTCKERATEERPDTAGINQMNGEGMSSDYIRKVLRQKGTAIFFPSTFYHRVTPIESGERFALVNWLQGPKFR